MTATITTLPDGRRQVKCDNPRCRTQAVTAFREVALKWARVHRCQTRAEGTTDGGQAS